MESDALVDYELQDTIDEVLENLIYIYIYTLVTLFRVGFFHS